MAPMNEEIKKEADLLTDYAQASKGAAKVTKRDILNMLEFAVNRASSRIHSEATNQMPSPPAPEFQWPSTVIVTLLSAAAHATAPPVRALAPMAAAKP